MAPVNGTANAGIGTGYGSSIGATYDPVLGWMGGGAGFAQLPSSSSTQPAQPYATNSWATLPGYGPDHMDADGTPETPVVNVTFSSADARTAEYFRRLTEYATQNHLPLPTAMTFEGLAHYAAAIDRVTRPAYEQYIAKSWEGRTTTLSASRPTMEQFDAAWAEKYGSTQQVLDYVGNHVIPNVMALGERGVAGDALDEIAGFARATSNLAINFVDLGLRSSPVGGAVQMMGGDFAIPTFDIADNQLRGAATVDVLTLGAAGFLGPTRELAGAVGDSIATAPQQRGRNKGARVNIRLNCWYSLKTDHPCSLKIDQG